MAHGKDGRSGLLWERWIEHAERQPDRTAIVCCRFGEPPRTWTWAGLWQRAGELAGAMVRAGVRAGDVCALILHQDFDFFALYLAAVRAGAVACVLAPPNPRIHPDKFRHGLEGMLARSGFDWIVTLDQHVPQFAELLRSAEGRFKGIVRAEDLLSGHERAPPLAPQDAGSACLIQHSSGTTGLQKPVMLSHRVVTAHVARLSASIELRETDVVASWLPLYHDMGLIAAFHLPLQAGIATVQLDPFEWVKVPDLLPQAISEFKATLCWLPNFAYNFMADRCRDEALNGVRLDSLRMTINCSEPVYEASHEKFLKRFTHMGLRSEALAASYAMAETTFAVTQTRPGRRSRCVAVDRRALAQGVIDPAAAGSADVRICSSSGPLIEGCRATIVGDDGQPLPDGRVGEIRVSSDFMFSGYRNYPEQTAAVLSDGCYTTGDLGFFLEGELYVVGRKKDLIIVAGKNLYPHDIEEAVSEVSGVIAGRVAAFGLLNEQLGTEEICVMAETNATARDELGKLRTAILRAGMGIDVTIGRVELVKPRTLVKSSSGKVARSTNRDRLLAGLVERAAPAAADLVSRAE